MSKRKKLLQKLRNNPKNVKYSELETLLSQFGFILMRVRGSHHIFGLQDDQYETKIIIPVHGSSVMPEYVKQSIALIDQINRGDERETDD